MWWLVRGATQSDHSKKRNNMGLPTPYVVVIRHATPYPGPAAVVTRIRFGFQKVTVCMSLTG